MEFSKHNISAQIHGSSDWFIVNLLSGNADILDKETAAKLQGNPNDITDAQWLQKGYVVDPTQEAAKYKKAYLDFLDMRESDEVQVFFVPWYDCNFACNYCFQEEYSWEPTALHEEIMDAFFDFMRVQLAGRRKYVTLFGGEPLLPGQGRREFLQKFANRLAQEKLDLALVTNGHSLTEYLDVFSNVNMREIQVTLDGPEYMHDLRRPKKGGQGTFAKIVQGIDAAMALGHSINLRMVVDKQNLHTLPELAALAIEKGWTTNPGFKTQLGRNYELHSCQADQEKIYSRVGLYRALLDIVQEHPHVLEFHKPAYSISRFLFEQGELPKPLFDSCTGTKTEWALDMQGRVFSCTATVGKEGEELGTFWPRLELHSQIIDEWESRDVLSIEKCRTCNLALACGGGCAAVSKNTHGSVLSPDCRPVDELMAMGISLYNQ